MKPIFYTGQTETVHSHAGLLKPGLNEVHRDDVADQLLAAGAITGDFLPGDAAARARVTRSSDGATWSDEHGCWLPELQLEEERAPTTAPEPPPAIASEKKTNGPARPRKEK